MAHYWLSSHGKKKEENILGINFAFLAAERPEIAFSINYAT